MNAERTLVIGDSWASAVVVGLPNHGGWPEILRIPMNLRQAIPGSTAIDWANDRDGRLTKAINTDCDTVIISLLGNDIRHALIDGIIHPSEVLQAVESYKFVVSKFLSKRICGLLYQSPFLDSQSQFIVTLLNCAIRYFGGDLWQFLNCQRILTTDRHFDGVDIHPNIEGHDIMAWHLKEMAWP